MAVVLSGKQAVTEYQTIAVYGEHGVVFAYAVCAENGPHASDTVHCAASGHPVAGDRVYGNAARDKSFFAA